MHRINSRLICIVLFVILGFVTASSFAQEAGFKPQIILVLVN